MPSLLEFFNNDFKELSLDRSFVANLTRVDEFGRQVGVENTEIKERVRQELNSSIRFFTYYIPKTTSTLSIIESLLNSLPEQIKQIQGLVAIGSFHGDKQFGNHSITYSNRVYFYIETLLSAEEALQLDEFCKRMGVFITIRSTDYIARKMETEKPVAFISHDSRDKELIAKRIAFGLNSRLCFVWYDEYSLKIGNSLRESIESGIKDAKKCIIVLTKNFLNNPGWSKREFNSIFTREMIKNERIVLPIWHGVTPEEVYDYSPSLADTFALVWPSMEDKSEEEYNQDVEKLISKLHTALTT